MAKSHLGRKGFSSLYGSIYSWKSLRETRVGNQGMNLEGMEECCVLACSLWFAQFVFLNTPRTPTQGRCTHTHTHRGCTHLLQSMIKKMRYRLAYRQSDRGSLSTEVTHPEDCNLWQTDQKEKKNWTRTSHIMEIQRREERRIIEIIQRHNDQKLSQPDINRYLINPRNPKRK